MDDKSINKIRLEDGVVKVYFSSGAFLEDDSVEAILLYLIYRATTPIPKNKKHRDDEKV